MPNPYLTVLKKSFSFPLKAVYRLKKIITVKIVELNGSCKNNDKSKAIELKNNDVNEIFLIDKNVTSFIKLLKWIR